MSKNTIGEISDKSRLDHSQNVSARDISDSVIIKIDNLVLHFEKDLLRMDDSLQLPTIQDVLRKDQIKDGEFFRSYLCWADLEQSFVLERKEVNEIIKKLEASAIQLVVGGPASGKSTTLKNIGFKLVNYMDVYYFDLKSYSDEEINELFEEIGKIKKASVFIVDDAHLFPEECKKLIMNFKKNGKGRLIIGSRDSPRIMSHPKEFNEFQTIENIKIDPYNISSQLIELFLKRKHNLEDNKVKIAINELETYKEDLWLLSWALLAYDPTSHQVNLSDIYQKIAESITAIGKTDGTINAEDIFFVLSTFYRFEIPVERKFIAQLGTI